MPPEIDYFLKTVFHSNECKKIKEFFVVAAQFNDAVKVHQHFFNIIIEASDMPRAPQLVFFF